jgi:hypothetical protein
MVSLEGQQIRAILDTGSENNLMALQTARDINANFVAKPSGRLKGIGGVVIILYCTSFGVIDGARHDFIVANIASPLILGLDFIRTEPDRLMVVRGNPPKEESVTKEDWQLNPKIANAILDEWEIQKKDVQEMFSNKDDHIFDDYITLEQDAFRQDWSKSTKVLYMNPPFSTLEKVEAKILRERPKMVILVVPEWKDRP